MMSKTCKHFISQFNYLIQREISLVECLFVCSCFRTKYFTLGIFRMLGERTSCRRPSPPSVRASIHSVLALNYGTGPSCFKSNDYFDNSYFPPLSTFPRKPEVQLFNYTNQLPGSPLPLQLQDRTSVLLKKGAGTVSKQWFYHTSTCTGGRDPMKKDCSGDEESFA